MSQNRIDIDEFIAIEAPIASIIVDARLREPDPKKIKALSESMRDIGLMTPISVEYETIDVKNSTYRLVAGLSRLEAAKALGWETIPAVAVSFASEEERELWEIDENLMRGELSPAEEAAHLSRRKELFILIGGTNSPTCPQYEKGFAQDTAEKTGENKREINRKIARAAALGEDIKEVVGTSLDKGTELDALAKIAPEERRPLIEAARQGATVSAVRVIRADCDIDTEQFNALVRAWNKTGATARRMFREFIDEPVMDAERSRA